MPPALPTFSARCRRLLGALAAAVAAGGCAGADGPPSTAAGPDAPSGGVLLAPIYRSHTEFGTPTDATPADEYLLAKRTHVLSYDCAAGGPNWVSWNLNRTHYGAAPRSASFYADPALPSGCYRVVSSDYTNSGYSRGHMVRSEERTWSSEDNAQTFLMTNVLPQHQDLNGGPWSDLERHLQTLAQDEDREIYVIAGGAGNRGTLNGAGRVVIPTHSWKVAVVMAYGRGLADATSTTSLEVIAVSMPNTAGIASRPWTDYRTTVDRVEQLSGYDLLHELPDAVERYWEAR